MSINNPSAIVSLASSLPGNSRKLKIMYIVTQADRGGAQMHLLELASAMRELCEVHVAAGEEGFLTTACRAQGITVHVLPHLRRAHNLLSDTIALWETRALLRAQKPDLIHVHTFKAGFIGRLAAWSLGIPVVYTIHAWLWGTAAVSRTASLLALPLERIAARWCDRIITVARAGEDLVRRYRIASPGKVVTIHNGIGDSPSLARHTRNITPIITMVARFTAGKDHEQLIRAFATLPQRARLWLVGDGETRIQMEQLVRTLGLSGRIEFLGEREDVPELLVKSDIFVLASESEMFPISILEAMRAGLPVVASDVGGVCEAVVHGKTGLLVPKGDTFALANALSVLIEKEDQRCCLGHAGRESFAVSFQRDVMRERLHRLYSEVLRSRGLGSRKPSLHVQHVAEVSNHQH